MKQVEIETCGFTKIMKLEMEKRVNGILDDQSAMRMFKTIMMGPTRYLALVKTTKNPVALTIEDEEGNFNCAAVVEYNEAAENEDDVTGNWNYYWTFVKEDIPENAVCYDIKDTQTHKTLIDSAWQDTSAIFDDTNGLIFTYTIGMGTLRDYLLENAEESEEYEMVYPGVFKAMAAVEDGEKVISITPDGLIKKWIKDDAALVANEETKTA